MRTGLSLISVVAALTAMAAGALAAQQPETPLQAFRSSVDLVSIQASVRDKKGRIVQGLTTTDFEVRDNGELRPLVSLRVDRQSPLSLAVLVDMSGSMKIGSKAEMARQALNDLISQLRDGEDEVALFTFDSSLHERRGFTGDLDGLRNALDDFESFGSTSLFDATASAARRLAERSATHKAVIVLTDGIDTSSEMTAVQVSGLASSIDVPVYVVATVPQIDQRTLMEMSERDNSDGADLRDLADWTGGQLAFASSFLETARVAAEMIGELRLQYVLSIQAADASEWRRLEVRVKNPTATVKARSGYYGGS